MFHVKQKKDEVKRCVMYCDDENEGGAHSDLFVKG